ncbi:DUF1631 family protein [Arenimonas caeni]|jgi:hypothetical protein|uniref:DUF1631 family protein n=1 Tax=Arenimonas caeni TaxID=2058085 RepID=UPI002A369F7D|nr:DUF1631 family protein [Arenimonas caeni]MDY0021116.1 DUF1631 family protein [Arenimonas caeni]
MNDPRNPGSDRPAAPAARELVAGMRRRSTEHLQAVLARVFARADDWLFDLAKKDGVPDGSPYLFAMRALRTSRAPIERGFREYLDRAFGGLESRTAPARQAEAGGEGLELSLLPESELEQQLATNLTAEAITRIHGHQLDELAGRLARMVGVAKLEADANPLSAHSLASAIGSAHGDVDLPDDVRMVLFKYYERELIHDLRDLLADLNAQLEAAGYRPDVATAKPVQRPAAPRPDMVAPPTADGYAPAASDYQPSGGDAGTPAAEDRAVYEALRQLLHAWRPAQQGGVAGGAVGGRQTGRGGQRPLQSNEMMSLLSLMQSSVPEAVNEALERPEVSLAALLKNELLRGATRIGLPPEQVSISQDDEDAVDLVGMLFDVMFDERDFEQSARTMISRLVVPFVKAAVMDRRLFLYKTHPARRLLNSLAEAVEGNRGEGPQERELLQKAENTVDRLIAEFNEDLAIFETLEQELRQFLEQHRRRVELAERRAAEAQRGQERLEQARDLAKLELEQRTRGLEPTPAMRDFLERCWTHHLSMIALREGPDSGSWQTALSVADRLLALLPKPGDPAEAIAPGLRALREPLETVLASSGIIGEAATDMIRGLGDSLERRARGQAQVPVAPAPEAAQDDKVVQLPDRRSAVQAALSDLKPRLEVVAGKKSLDVSDSDVEQMRQLKVGTWIHIAGEDGKHHPVKLSWVSPISSRLMFVNRRGVRVLVASVEELAAMKQEGNLLVREQEQVFDQVLHRVMGKLRDDLG